MQIREVLCESSEVLSIPRQWGLRGLWGLRGDLGGGFWGRLNLEARGSPTPLERPLTGTCRAMVDEIE